MAATSPSPELKLLAQGAHGCVFKGITCSNEKEFLPKGTSYITKVLNEKNGNDELKEYETLGKLFHSQGIKNSSDYFIDKSNKCNPNSDPTEAIKKTACKQKSPYIYLSYEDGGNSLSKTLTNAEKNLSFYINLFNSLLNVFKGVNELNNKDLYIFDLKPDNIVYNTETNVLKMVDLGGVKLLQGDIDKDTETNILDLTQGKTPSFLAPEMLARESNGKVIYLSSSAFGGAEYVVLKENKDKTWSLELGKNLNKLKKKESSIILDEIKYDYYLSLPIKKRFEKNDIFALGIILLIIYNDILDDYDEDEEFISKVEDLFNHVIKPMMKLDVDKRVNSGDALKLYEEWLLNLELPLSYLTPPESQEDPHSPTHSPTHSTHSSKSRVGGRFTRRYRKRKHVTKRHNRRRTAKKHHRRKVITKRKRVIKRK
jgi:serine/threonine protein kinase